jgi:CRISPR-associated protein Cas2
MQLLVVYDIPNDARRIKVADACLDFGLDRIQFSVFTGALSNAHRKDLVARLKRILSKTEGKIMIVAVNQADWDTREEIVNLAAKPDGQAAAPTTDEGAPPQYARSHD